MSDVKKTIPESTSAAVQASIVMAVSLRLIGFGASQRLVFRSMRANIPFASGATATAGAAAGWGAGASGITANATFAGVAGRGVSASSIRLDCGSGMFGFSGVGIHAGCVAGFAPFLPRKSARLRD